MEDIYKTTRLEFRLTTEQKARLHTICHELDCSMGAFVREAINDKIATECEMNDINLFP